MKLTLSVIKADIGSIGGHIAPSRRLLEAVRGHIREHGRRLLVDHRIGHTGITQRLEQLERQFRVRPVPRPRTDGDARQQEVERV